MSLELLGREVLSCSSSAGPWALGLVANSTLLLLGLLSAGTLLGARRAPLRHLLGGVGLACLVLIPGLNLLVSWEWGLGGFARASWSALPFPAAAGPGVERALVIAWAAGAGLMMARLAADRCLLWWYGRRGAAPAPRRWGRRAARLGRRLGVRRPVRVLLTPGLDIPCTWGLLRPVVLLPRRALTWSDERLGAVLLHELGHVRRLDGLFIALARLACALYWFHPLAWWLQRRVAEDAERACDALVVAGGVAPERYARHLLGIVREARRRLPSLASAMAAESHLARRITALVEGRASAPGVGWKRAALALTGLAVATVLLANVSVAGALSAGPGGGEGADCSEPALESPPAQEPHPLQSIDPELLGDVSSF